MIDDELRYSLSEQEYKECRFIEQEMRFIFFKEFLRDAYVIKKLYKKLPHKVLYKWYLYANIHLTLKQKDHIWEYLNNDIEFQSLLELS